MMKAFQVLEDCGIDVGAALEDAEKYDTSEFIAPTEFGDWTAFWGLGGGYRETEMHLPGDEAHLRTGSAEITCDAYNERWVVSLAMPYDHIAGTGAYDNFDSERLSMQAVPQYLFLDQFVEGMDLTFLGVARLSHTWYNNTSFPLDDTDTASLGVGTVAGKTFAFGDLRLGYVFQSNFNLDGDEELNGKSNLNIHGTSLTYSVPITEQVYAQLETAYTHTSELPDGFDADVCDAGLTLGYVESEDWRVTGTLNRSWNNDDWRSWSMNVAFTLDW